MLGLAGLESSKKRHASPRNANMWEAQDCDGLDGGYTEIHLTTLRVIC